MEAFIGYDGYMFKILHSVYFAETYPDEWAAICEFFSPEQLIDDVSQINSGDWVDHGEWIETVSAEMSQITNFTKE